MTIGKEIKRVSVSMNAQFSNQNVDDTENAINSLRWVDQQVDQQVRL